MIRPHGLGGLLRIWSYTRSEEPFLSSGAVCLRPVSGEPREFKVLSVTPHKNIYLMKLEGLGSFEEADTYRGAEITIEPGSLRRSGENEFFWHELIGLKVYLEDGEFIGTIQRILPTGAHDIYVVREGKGEVLIPAVHDVVKEIDLDRGSMMISEMEGLLDLNET